MKPYRQALIATVVSSLAGCIIPDRDIKILGLVDNEFAVKFVEPLKLTENAELACWDQQDPHHDHDPEDFTCPQPPAGGAPGGLLRPPTGSFCVCPDNQYDGNRLSPFFVYAEDGDEENGAPKDDLFLALLLLDNPTLEPFNQVAYRNLRVPTQPGRLVPRTPYEEPIGRPDPQVREFVIASPVEFVDLCNDDEQQRLSVGPHQIRAIVTDRPWFTEIKRDADNEIRLGPDGKPILGNPQHGVPDVANSATYDTLDWVFFCGDSDNPEDGCNCIEQESSP